MGDIGKHFDKDEFECRCGCGFDTVSPALITILDIIRDSLNRPLWINSGCRCRKWNKKKKGKKRSAHLNGLAVDIKVRNSGERYALIQVLYAIGITRIGEARTFIHIDIDETKPQKVEWLY